MEIEKGMTYTADHKPSGESWLVLGIDVKGDRVCAAGWPPTIAKLSDCDNVEAIRKMYTNELQYRNKEFGTNWDN